MIGFRLPYGGQQTMVRVPAFQWLGVSAGRGDQQTMLTGPDLPED